MYNLTRRFKKTQQNKFIFNHNKLHLYATNEPASCVLKEKFQFLENLILRCSVVIICKTLKSNETLAYHIA